MIFIQKLKFKNHMTNGYSEYQSKLINREKTL